jgi:hypothetical protein
LELTLRLDVEIGGGPGPRRNVEPPPPRNKLKATVKELPQDEILPNLTLPEGCTHRVVSQKGIGDDHYGALVRAQDYFEYFWNAYGFRNNEDYWSHGWGLEDAYNTDKPLARILNGCYALTYSAPDYENQGFDKPILNWAPRFVAGFVRDLRPKCNDGPGFAESFPGQGLVTLFLPYFYAKDVPGRAETLVHESRHLEGMSHDAAFPPHSHVGKPGRQGADSSWEREGAWMYAVLYLAWFARDAARTTTALRERARERANLLLDGAFTTPPDFRF